MPGKPEPVAQRVYVGRDQAEVFDDHRHAPKLGVDRVKERPPGPGTQVPLLAVSSSAGTSQ